LIPRQYHDQQLFCIGGHQGRTGNHGQTGLFLGFNDLKFDPRFPPHLVQELTRIFCAPTCLGRDQTHVFDAMGFQFLLAHTQRLYRALHRATV
jgi:hypothetical protein